MTASASAISSKSRCSTAGNIARAKPVTGRRTRAAAHLESNASCPERLRRGPHHAGLRAGSLAVFPRSPIPRRMEFDRAGRADGAVRGSRQNGDSPSGPTIGTAIRPIARGCSSASTTPRCPIRSLSAATSIRSSPTICGSISTIRRRRWSRRNSSAPRFRPTGPPYDMIAQALPDNPHVHFFESRRRGYVSVDLDARAHAGAHACGLRRRTIPKPISRR